MDQRVDAKRAARLPGECGEEGWFMGKHMEIMVCGRQRGSAFRRGRMVAVLLSCIFLYVGLAGCKMDRALTLETWEKGAEGTEGIARDGEDGTTAAVDPMICVHVCGAVADPGLKELPAGSRAWDALKAAGGFTEEADESYVNLAGFLTDGQKLYFPTREEVREQAQAAETSALIDLNLADEERLCTLPGIGSSRAKAIIKYRKERGGFQSVEELLSVPGIKEGLYDQIRDLVTVGS